MSLALRRDSALCCRIKLYAFNKLSALSENNYNDVLLTLPYVNILLTLLYALVLCYFYIIYIFIILHCPQSGPDLIYISLLIIPCIIYYVTNKETLNLDVNKCSVAEASCAEHDYCLMHSFDHSSKDGCICTWPASHLNAALGHTAPVPFLGRRKKRERERGRKG